MSEMKQPKFKFGEAVEFGDSHGCRNVFRVEGIEWRAEPFNEYYYAGQGYGCVEKCLEPHREPVKRKLYAARDKVDGMIFHFSDEWAVDAHVGSNDRWRRTPEYDIDFGGAKRS